MLRWTLVCAILAVWAVAIQAWPDLPARIPIHYDLAGNPDGWVDKGVLSWFGLPAVGTLLGGVVGLLLPVWTERMAAANSPYLNVPDKRRFAALSAAARVRAVAPMRPGLAVVGLAVQGLFFWIVYGGAAVAGGRWQTLPSWPTFVAVAVIVAAALGMTLASSRAVRREFATFDKSGTPPATGR
ncbi:MAG: hypothetical protein RL398_2259 [Planctomycetota bacterium]|jgi:uncharacterized membrane protein